LETQIHIPIPFLFNPLKHYLPFIRSFAASRTMSVNDPRLKDLTREIKHIGSRVMDIYKGSLTMDEIFDEIIDYLESKCLLSQSGYMAWIGRDSRDFRIITLSDGSRWTLKYHDNATRFVHIFPTRSGPHSFRTKANTLKSAILYLAVIGKDYVTDVDLNAARVLAGLSPVGNVADAEAVTEMIEIIRSR